MENPILSKRNLLAILLGFAINSLIGVVAAALNFFVSISIFHNFSVRDFNLVLTQPPILGFAWLLLGVFSYLPPVIGGLVVGWMVKEKGWFYGGLLGLFLTVISLGFASLYFILPTSSLFGDRFPVGYGQAVALKESLTVLLGSPITIGLTLIGGFLGERFRRRNRSVPAIT